MLTLGIVPARAGSKRLPGKNTLPLGGKALVAWAIEAGRGAARVDTLVVSSDDQRVLETARRYQGVVALERPRELADDESPAIDYVRHALAAVEGQSRSRFDVVVILQPTSPFTLSSDIDGTVDLLVAAGADTAVTVVELDHAVHPVKLKVLDGDKLLPYLEDEKGRMAHHELPRLFVRNCSVYATRRAVVDSGRIIGDDCRGFVMPRARSIDINDEVDFRFAEFLLERRTASPSL